MNLLVLSTWFPYPADNGSRVRIYNLMRQLSRHFTIRLVAGAQEDSPVEIPEALREICADVVRVPWIWHRGESQSVAGSLRALASAVPRSILETPNPAMTAAIAEQLRHPTDAILVCELGMDAYLPSIPPSIPIVMEGAEITGMQQAYVRATGSLPRLRAKLMHAKGARYWRRALSRYTVVTAASLDEASALRDLLGGSQTRVIVVPNGVDVDAYPPRDPRQIHAGRIIYNGALTYGPNRDAVDFFVDAILPRVVDRVPDAHLVVTGRYDAESARGLSAHPRVELTGYLEDLKPTLASASVCVVPLLSGGGTRLKILEAWAAGLPVVSTRIGAAGLEGAHSGHQILLADRPDAFADAVVSLLTTSSVRDSVSAKARQLVEARYTWTAASTPLIAALRGAVELSSGLNAA